MKLLSLLALLLFVTVASADDSIIMTCRPGNFPNGLGLSLLSLEISTEDPVAKMTLTYENSRKPSVRVMDYNATSTRYHFTPTSRRDGTVSVFLKKKNGAWMANVTDAGIDTFSVLGCR